MNDSGELDSVDRALLRELQKDARQTNKALAETVGIMALTGTTDFIIHVAVRDMNHLRDLVWGLIERPEVGRVQSSLVFARAEGPGLDPLEPARTPSARTHPLRRSPRR